MNVVNTYNVESLSDNLSPRSIKSLPFFNVGDKFGNDNDEIEFSSNWLSDSSVLIDIQSFDNSIVFAFQKHIGFFFPVDIEDSCRIFRNPFADEEEIVDLKWLNVDCVAIACTSGYVRVVNRDARVIFSQRFHTCPPTKLTIVNGICSSFREISTKESLEDNVGELWILHEDGVIATVRIYELIGLCKTENFEDESLFIVAFRKWALHGQEQVISVVCCGPTKPTLFQSHARVGSYTILAAGIDPPLGFYDAGTDSGNIHLGQIATAVASKVANVAYSAVSSFARSWGWSGRSITDEERKAQIEEQELTIAARPPEEIYAGRILKDSRRNIRSLSLDPTDRLAVTTDNFGRVILIDTSCKMIVRIWKGYRNAQCAWIQSAESWSGQREGVARPTSPRFLSANRSKQSMEVSYGLYLVIYSPLRGIVEVWRTRNGPLVLSIPVGYNARIFTMNHDSNGVESRARCLVLKSGDSNELSGRTSSNKIEISEVDITEGSLSTVYAYFLKNNNQEESFLLHRSVDKLRTAVRLKQQYKGHDEKFTACVKELMNLVTSFTSIYLVSRFMLELDELNTHGFGTKFHLDLTNILITITKNEIKAKGLSEKNRKVLWELNWRGVALKAFEDLQVELGGVMSDYSAEEEILSSSTLYSETHTAYGDLKEWVKILETWGLDVETNYLRLTDCVEFKNIFNVPTKLIENVKLDRCEKEDGIPTIAEVFKSTKTPVLKRYTESKQNRRKFLGSMFAPLLEDVFSVARTAEIHTSLLLDPLNNCNLFIEWFFQIPLLLVLRMPISMASSPLQRWIRNLFKDSLRMKEDINRAQDEDILQLPEISLASLELFEACMKTEQLIHAFLLCEHCKVAERSIAEQLESETLGKFNSAGAGLRWSVLQECITKTMYLSIRLNVVNRLSINSVESVDPIYRLLSVAMLNKQRRGSLPPVRETHASNRVMYTTQDLLMDCKTVLSKENSYAFDSVIRCFPQFNVRRNHITFNLLVLLELWQHDRSKMVHLEDAIKGLRYAQSQFGNSTAALALYIWENSLTVHAFQLKQHWEQFSDNDSPSRTVEPSIAKRLFSCMKEVLEVLLDIIKPKVLDSENEDYVKNEYDEHYKQYSYEYDDESENDEDSLDLKSVDDLIERGKWIPSVLDTKAIYSKNWPSGESEMMRKFEQWNPKSISIPSLQDHIILICVLESFILTNVKPISPSKLFFFGTELCKEGSLCHTYEKSNEESNTVTLNRMKYIRELIKCDSKIALELANLFQLPLEELRQEYVLYLYQTGQDVLAEENIVKLQFPKHISIELACLARKRLSKILKHMNSSTQYAPLMTSLPADICSWIPTSSPPLESDKGLEFDGVPSIIATTSLLQRCVQLFSSNTAEYKYSIRMLQISKGLMKTVSWTERDHSA